jgi:hypothetical protein
MEIIIDSYRVKNDSLHVILHVKKYLDYYVDGRFGNSILCLPDAPINKPENEKAAPSILNEDYYCSGWPVMIDPTPNHLSCRLEPAGHRRAASLRNGIAGIGSNIPVCRELILEPVNACHYAKGE